MRKLIVSEFMTLDGVMQAPGGKDEDTDGGFEHGGWTIPYWHDDIGKSFFALMEDVRRVPARPAHVRDARRGVRADAGGRRLRRRDERAKNYVVSRTLEKPVWRNTTDHPRQRRSRRSAR